MKEITWNDFEIVEIRSGTVTKVEDFPEARNPAFKVWVDFGEDIGLKKTSSQITELYSQEDLLGKQVMGIINFPKKQVGKFMSEFLLMGFYSDNGVVLAIPDSKIKNGLKLL